MSDELKPGETRHLGLWRDADITGMLSPFRHNDQPVLMQLPDHDDHWVMVFSSKEKLEAAMEKMGVSIYKIKRVDDGMDFIESITEAGVRIALDPRTVDGEKTRWTEIKI